MKKIIYLLGIMAMVTLTSCDLDTPAQSTLEESIIFSTPGLAIDAVDGIKEPFGQTNSYRGRFIPWYGMNTDVEWNNNGQNYATSDQYDLVNYDPKSVNSQMNTDNNAWAQMYASIERANIVIRGIRTYGNPIPGSEMGELLGEALTLRAIVYADLTKAWGDVPARFEPITGETVFLPKSSRDVIYKQLLADLDEAADLVPWPNESILSSSVERVNKAFVKGLRARIALIAGGYQQYPDGIRLSTDPDLSRNAMYTIALNECQDVINSGTAHLESTFETLWRKVCLEDTSAGGEALWQLPFNSGRGRVCFTFGVRHRSVDQHTGQARGGVAGPTPTLFYDYAQADQRRDVTCVPYEWGTADANGWSQQQLTSIDQWNFGKYRYEWMDRFVTSSNDDGLNWMYMRYAEVLLMAAEASNELNGPAAAAPYLRQVRERAFAPADRPVNVDAYIAAAQSSPEAMFNAIVEEHKLEFTGEMLRKQALIRWNLLGDKLDEAKMKMNNLSSRIGEYADIPTTLYWKIDENDNESLVVYGLNSGEEGSPGADYSSQTWDVVNPDKINSIYKPGVDPDAHQFWPIWQVFIEASNGQLVNDYGY